MDEVVELSNVKEWGQGVFNLLSWFETERVKKARVIVIGSGALGNEVLKNLALFGVGNIYVVDFDTIEYTNLTRSILFREEDADKGYFKADVAARRVREINKSVNIHPIVGRLDSDVGLGLYRNVDVVVGCLDSRLARIQLNRQCIRADVPWIDGSIENLDGLASVYRKGVSCYECELPESSKEAIFKRTSCADVAQRNISSGRVPTTPVIASIIGAVQAQEAMKIIHEGYVDNNIFSSLSGWWFKYEGSHMKVSKYKSGLWVDDCLAHEEWTPVISIDTIGADTTVGDTLRILSEELHSNYVEINLRNTRFVDKLVTRGDNKVFMAMCPENKVADYIDNEPQLFRQLPGDINQNAIENIDEYFQYKNITLRQIGIPYWDVIQVSTEDKVFYVEMAADKGYYDRL